LRRECFEPYKAYKTYKIERKGSAGVTMNIVAGEVRQYNRAASGTSNFER
jgi:hypothetical protein